MIAEDLRRKARWCYGADRWTDLLKVLFTDGTAAMVVYRLMQWSRRKRLTPLEMLCNKLNAIGSRCIIGRGAEFGPGLVLVHAMGVVINGSVRGGSNVTIEHQVTIGADRRRSPTIGDDVFIGAGAKILGAVTVGDGARIGANAVVVHDVPAYSTVVGVPARVVRQRTPGKAAVEGFVDEYDFGPASMSEAVGASPHGDSNAAASSDDAALESAANAF